MAPLRVLICSCLMVFRVGGISRLATSLDALHVVLIWGIVGLMCTHRYFELSFWYHAIRSQSQIKLYGII